MPEEILETSQTTQPLEPKSTDWPKVVLVAVLGLGLLAASAYAGYYYGTQQVQQVEEPTPVASQPTPTPEPAPTPTPSPTTTTVPCENDDLGITLDIPESWSCKSSSYWITISSNLYTIDISNLGRGFYCTPGPETTCETSHFYSNDVLDLGLYSENNEDREIFGMIKRDFFEEGEPSVWFGITYEGMDKRKLTSAEKNELTEVLNSLQFLQN